jgi:hypothetical protein
MNRLAGIVIAGLGLLAAVLNILKVVPGVTGSAWTVAGVTMIVLGGLIIGLSFIDKPPSEGVERMSTGSTLLNIFFSPSEVFQNLKRHPRWLVAVIMMALLSAVYATLFYQRLTPERIANYTIDKTLEMPMVANNEQARKQVEDGRKDAIEDAKSPASQAGRAVSGFAWQVIGITILAAIFMLFALAMGGTLYFWQAFSAVAYAALPVAVIRFILNTVLLYIKDPSEIHPILGQSTLIQDNLNFLVKASENPVIYSFLGSFSLLWIYWIFLNGIGLKNAGEKVSGSIAWTAVLVVWVVIVLLGMGAAWAFPSFIS